MGREPKLVFRFSLRRWLACRLFKRCFDVLLLGKLSRGLRHILDSDLDAGLSAS